MIPTPAEAVLREHLRANPEAQHAALHDPEYAAEVHRMQAVLGHLDAALTDEDLPGEARRRIMTRLTGDCMGTDEANARMRNRDLTVRRLAEGVVIAPLPL